MEWKEFAVVLIMGATIVSSVAIASYFAYIGGK
jgi:hypothetical protein